MPTYMQFLSKIKVRQPSYLSLRGSLPLYLVKRYKKLTLTKDKLGKKLIEGELGFC
jgi:hypothetical protein